MNICYNKEIPVKRECDVFVAGGGPAGVAAAVAASRAGADVLLVEEQSCLGGMGTSGLVPVFMSITDGENFLIGDIGREIIEGMNGQSERVHEWDGILSISTENLKRAYDKIVVESGAELLLTTKIIDVICQNQFIDSVVLSAKSGIYAIKAKVYIDGTGDGDLAVWAGAPFEKGENGHLMGSTLCSLWAGIDWSCVERNDSRMLDKAIAEGCFSQADRHLPGIYPVGYHVGGGNLGHVYCDGSDEEQVTKALIQGRKQQKEYEAYYKKYLTGFENMELVSTAAMLGIRETRRITGEYQLTLQDFMDRASFEDEIGRYSYPVDIHAPDSSADEYEVYYERYRNLRYRSGENYGIPFRALIPLKVQNLLVAGRCISADRYVQSSVRVMTGCYITGQAAGTGAALALDKGGNVRDIDVRALQKKLKEMGLHLPNFAEKCAENSGGIRR